MTPLQPEYLAFFFRKKENYVKILGKGSSNVVRCDESWEAGELHFRDSVLISERYKSGLYRRTQPMREGGSRSLEISSRRYKCIPTCTYSYYHPKKNRDSLLCQLAMQC
jgi:hypothetical protein